MHVCEEFSERITESILDRCEFDHDVELQREMLACNRCSEFYVESRELIEAISAVRFDIEDARWDAMSEQIRRRILADQAARTRPSWRSVFVF